MPEKVLKIQEIYGKINSFMYIYQNSNNYKLYVFVFCFLILREKKEHRFYQNISLCGENEEIKSNTHDS